MEVKAGYKQTEVGVIPEGWEVKRLGTVIAIRNAKVNTFGADVASFCVELEQVGQNSGQIDGHSDARARQSVKYRFDQGDVLFGRLRPYLRKFWWADREGVCSTEIWPFIPVDGQLTSGFLFQTVQTDTFIQAANSSYGTHMPRADWSALTQFEILVPGDLAEQTAIATALSDVDGLLGGLDRLIAKKRDLKQAAMQQLLTGQTRLPGFRGEWEVKRLGDVVQIKKGQLITSSTLKPGDIPVIAGGKQPAYYHASANRFGRTVTISASGASAGYVALYDEPIFASDCSTISESESYCLAFVFYQLLCKQQVIYKAQTGGAQPHIHAKDLNPIPFAFPPLPEQTAIASVLTEMDAERAGLEQRREKTRALKQAMMQELLTGRTRLVSAESAYA